MIGQLSLTALAALGAVQGSPLINKRQASAASSAVSSAISSVASSAAGSATSAVESVTSAASGASSTAAEAASTAAGAATTAVESPSSAISSAVSSAVATATGTAAAPNATATGNSSNPLFPCPAGFLLTYVNQNATVPIPITQVTPALGEWANSPIFPNVTMPQGSNTIGATHTLNIAGLPINEVLVNVSSNDTSGYVSWTWNLTNGPLNAGNVTIANWTAQLNVYDPEFSTTGQIGNETVADAFVNFCASEQEAGAALLDSVLQLYLGNAAQALQGANSTAASTTSAVAGATSSVASAASSSAAAATSGAAAGASSAAGSATSAASAASSTAAAGASSAAGSATSAASAASSAASGAVASATSAAAGAASSAVGAATTSA